MTTSLNPTQSSARRKAWMKMVGLLLLIVLVTGGIWGYNLNKMIQGFMAMGVPKQAVSTTVLEPQKWRDSLEVIGSVRAVRGADLALEVPGVIDSIQFESGRDVNAGAELLRLTDKDEQVRLETLRTSLALAQSNFERDRQQLAAKLISQVQFDASQNAYKSAQLAVQQQEVALAKKRLLAPFAGRLGLRSVDVGQYVQPGMKLATLQALDKVYVDFNLPQSDLGKVSTGSAVRLRVDSLPGEWFDGVVSALDAKVDSDTRNVTLRATVNNPRKHLLPGMFVRGTLEVGQEREFLTLPLTAVTYNPYGESLFVVLTLGEYERETREANAKQGASAPAAAPTLLQLASSQASVPVLGKVYFKLGPLVLAKTGEVAVETSQAQPKRYDPAQLVVKQVFVKVGPKRGDQVAILSGVNAGQQVVTSGQLKLKSGAHVVINNQVVPTSEPAPTPREQ